jgi:hypothetical protein
MDGRAAKMFFADMNEGLMIESQLVRECDNSSSQTGVSRQLGHDTESLIRPSTSLALW